MVSSNWIDFTLYFVKAVEIIKVVKVIKVVRC